MRCAAIPVCLAFTALIAPLAALAAVQLKPAPLEPGATYPHPMSVSITAPWPQKGTWQLRAPETIGSNHGLLFIDHTRPDMPPVTAPKAPLSWTAGADGWLSYRCSLENGVTFSVRMKAGQDDVTITSSLSNHFREHLSNLGTQFCLIQRGVEGFEDPYAERTFILVDGRFKPLAKTRPGLPKGAKPFFIVTNTRDLKPMEKASIERSWFADEQADIPLIATVSSDGRRIIGLAFENAYKIMTNADIPCIHADPMYPDCRRGAAVGFRGKVYFVEGSLTDLLARFHRDFPQWKARASGQGR